MSPFPQRLFDIGPLTVTDTMAVSFVLAVLLAVLCRVLVVSGRLRAVAAIAYDALERAILQTTDEEVRPLVPLVLTQWLFIGAANLVGLVPGIGSPTRDLSVTAALAVIAFLAGHVHAARTHGLRYLRGYLEPSPFLLPLNVLAELTRTVALALRLFGNMLSGALVTAVVVYVAALLVPVPLMLLGVLTGVVQAYIFGVLTLVFAAGSAEAAARRARAPPKGESHGTA